MLWEYAGMFKGGLVDHEPQTIKHHTAHHLLLAALRQVLGNHVLQRGSNVSSERLRIDFSHPEKVTAEQLKKVEDEDIGLGGDGRNFSKLSENDRIVAELLRGLAVSKRGEGENSYSRHSFLSVGLAELLSDQMGKLDKAVIKPNIGKGRDEVCLKAEGLLNEIPAGIVKNQYKTAWDILKSEIY